MTHHLRRPRLEDLSGGWRQVARALAVPAGIPRERDDHEEEDPTDPDDVRDAIVQIELDDGREREVFVA